MLTGPGLMGLTVADFCWEQQICAGVAGES